MKGPGRFGVERFGVGYFGERRFGVEHFGVGPFGVRTFRYKDTSVQGRFGERRYFHSQFEEEREIQKILGKLSITPTTFYKRETFKLAKINKAQNSFI